LTSALKEALAAEQDGELERFYQSAGYAPVWVDRREEAIAALMTAKAKGLKPEDYLRVGKTTAETDIALTKGLMRYAGDLRNGRWNPGIYGKPAAASLGDLAWSIARNPGGVEAGLGKLDPPFAEYKRLETALEQYRKQSEVDIAALEQVRQIERTLERWRWLPRTLERGAILVNIPEFRLKALDQNLDTTLDMKVIVGLTKHPTPLFTANLQYVVFGPYWNVPKSILLNELVPDIVKDRTYLARNAYEVVNAGGQVVSTGEVSDEVLAGLKSGTLRVRQVPGPKNALGRVKFLFPNENDVYLHDTPSRNLFGRDQRALSHGCVRVENPEALAQWVLRGETDWSQERIAAGLKQTKPLQANLQQAIPVFMLYHTVTVGEDGEVHFWKDLYKQDAALAAKIAVTTGEPGQRPRE
jgi:murein L,D-transpeptidase YcbB/YkuD